MFVRLHIIRSFQQFSRNSNNNNFLSITFFTILIFTDRTDPILGKKYKCFNQQMSQVTFLHSCVVFPFSATCIPPAATMPTVQHTIRSLHIRKDRTEPRTPTSTSMRPMLCALVNFVPRAHSNQKIIPEQLQMYVHARRVAGKTSNVKHIVHLYVCTHTEYYRRRFHEHTVLIWFLQAGGAYMYHNITYVCICVFAHVSET